MLIDAHKLPITPQQIACYTRKDPLLSKVLQGLITGKDIQESQTESKPFIDAWGELSVKKGCFLKGATVVVPTKLSKQILEELHADHKGIIMTKFIACTFVWCLTLIVLLNHTERYVKDVLYNKTILCPMLLGLC